MRQFAALRRLFRGLGMAALAAACLTGCLGNRKVVVDSTAAEMKQPEPGQFPHEMMDEVQGKYVNEDGLVDYDGLDADQDTLRKYIGYLQAYSPKSHPALFPTKQDQLAYYINAYNAFVLYGVVSNYPGIQSVNDVDVGGVKLKDGQGFFYSQKFTMGGEEINLYDLENQVIRKFDDPRIHAAINCASMGCPKLPTRAFHAATLDQELDEEIRKFLAERRNVLVDDNTKTVRLSKIMDWFGEDFTQYVTAQGGAAKPSVLDYVVMYTDGDLKAAVERARSGGYKVEFREYDWALNLKGAVRPEVA